MQPRSCCPGQRGPARLSTSHPRDWCQHPGNSKCGREGERARARESRERLGIWNHGAGYQIDTWWVMGISSSAMPRAERTPPIVVRVEMDGGGGLQGTKRGGWQQQSLRKDGQRWQSSGSNTRRNGLHIFSFPRAPSSKRNNVSHSRSGQRGYEVASAVRGCGQGWRGLPRRAGGEPIFTTELRTVMRAAQLPPSVQRGRCFRGGIRGACRLHIRTAARGICRNRSWKRA